MARKLNNVIKTSSANGEKKAPRKLNNVRVSDTKVYSTQKNADDSLNKLQEYARRVQNNEYMTASELADYRRAKSDYTNDSRKLNDYAQMMGGSVDAAANKQRYDWLNGLGESLDRSEQTMSGFDNAEDYGKAVEQYETEAPYRKKYEGKSYAELKKALEDLNTKTKIEGFDPKRNGNISSPSGPSPADVAERKWLEQYAASVKTADDYQDDIYNIDKRIAQIESDINAYDSWRMQTGEAVQSNYREFANKYGTKADAERELELLKKQRANAEAKIKYGYLAENADYDEYSTVLADSNMLMDGYYNAVLKEYNKRNGIGEKNGVRVVSSDFDKVYERLYNSEIADVLYLFNTGRVNEAHEYLDLLKEELNYREGEKIAENINNLDNKWLKGFAQAGSAIVSAIDNYVSGAVVQPFSEEAVSVSKHQYASAPIRKGIESKIGKIGYDLLSSTVNMAPGILLSSVLGAAGAPTAVAQAAGGIAIGASAAGNAYAEAKRMGYTTKQARNYGVLVGASEAALQYVLGGIEALGGSVSGNIIAKSVQNIDNALLKVAAEIGINMASEGAEEYLQEILNPVFRNMMLGEDNEIKLVTEEAAYSFLLGALSAGLLEGGNIIADNVNRRNYYEDMYVDDASALVDEALELDPGYEYGEKMKSRIDDGKKLNGSQIEKLAAHNNDFIRGADTTAIADRLYELGETGYNGNVDEIAGAIAKMEAGEKLTNAESRLISKSMYGEYVVKERAKALEESVPNSIKGAVSEKDDNTPVTENVKAPDLQSNAEGLKPAINNEGVVATATDKKGKSVGVKGYNDAGELVTTEGIVDINELEFDDPVYADVVEDAKAYKGAEDLYIRAFSYLPGNINPAMYSQAFNNFYTAGSLLNMGIEFDSRWAKDKNAYLNVISEDYARLIFDTARKIALEKRNEQSRKHDADVKKNADGKKKKGKVHLDIDESTLTKRQKVSVEVVERIAKAIKAEVYFYASYLDENNVRVYKNAEGNIEKAPNGFYDPKDGSIHLDINAGDTGKSLILFTAAHELTHLIKNQSAVKFDALADFLMEQYHKKGVDIAELIDEQIEKARENGRTIDYDTAYEEAVASSMETMLSDGKLVEKLSELSKKDKDIVQKIADYFKELADKIRAVYKNLVPESREGQLVAEMVEATEQLQELFFDALKDVSETGVVVSESSKNAEVKNSYRNYDEPITMEDVESLRSIITAHNGDPVSVNDFTAEDIEKAQKWAYKFYKELGVKSPFFRAWFGDWRAYTTKENITVVDNLKQKNYSAGNTINTDMERKISWDSNTCRESSINAPAKYKSDMRIIASNMSDIVKNAVYFNTYVSHKDSNRKMDGTAFMHHLYSIVETGKKHYLIKVYAEEAMSTKNSEIFTRAYSLKNIKIVADFDNGVLLGDKGLTSSPSATTYSISELFNLVKTYDPEFKPHPVHESMIEDGQPKVLYHQTENEFTVFDTKRKGAGESDNETPFGVFLKSSNRDIGLRGKKQMPLYAKITNPLVAQNRSDLVRLAVELSPEYAELYNRSKEIDREYKSKVENAQKTFNDFIIKNSESPNRKTRQELYEDEEFNALFDAEDNLVEEWQKVNRENDYKAKEALTKALRDNGYDGVWLEEDVGSFGRKTDAYIVFDPEQVKSATTEGDLANIGTFSKYDSDIRYSTRASSRSMLVSALEPFVQTEEERAQLEKYKNDIEAMEAKERRLSELREEINDMQFTRGKRDTKFLDKLSDLREEARKMTSELTRYDESILKLESTQALKTLISRERASATKLEKAKAEKAKQRAARRREIAETRRKTLNIAYSIESLLSRETKNRNIKEGMKDVGGKLLSLSKFLFEDVVDNADIARLGIEGLDEDEKRFVARYVELADRRDALNAEEKKIRNDDSVSREIREQRLKEFRDKHRAEREAMTKEISRFNNVELKAVFDRERRILNRRSPEKVIGALEAAYRGLQNSDSDYIKDVYSDLVLEKITSLKNDLEGVIAGEMTLSQTQSVYEVFKMVKHAISQADKLFADNKSGSLSNTVSNVHKEIDVYKHDDKRIGAMISDKFSTLNKFSWNNLKPGYAFRRIGSKTLEKLFMNLAMADGTWARDIDEARTFIEETREKYGYKKWNIRQTKTFTMADGRELILTLGNMQAIYAYSKREQALDHMRIGGFKFVKGAKFGTLTQKSANGKYEGVKERTDRGDTYRMTTELINDIVASLTPEQKQYVDALQEYMSNELASKGNTVSMKLFGIELFKEKNYMPIQSVRAFLNSVKVDVGAVETMVSLKNTGMTKPTKPHAENPIVLKEFEDFVFEHIDTMAKYHAYVLPIEDMQRVFNAGTYTADNKPISTKSEIESVYGGEARVYFENYIRDLNGGNRGGALDSLPMMLFSRMKKNEVVASLSVAIQQPFAIIRAMAMIDPKYFIGAKGKTNNDLSLYKEMRKYAPITIVKEIGGYDMGSSRSATEFMGRTKYGLEKAGSAIDKVSMSLSELMDRLGWSAIWIAVKNEVADTNKDLKVGSQEFFEKCNERFTEVITYTQVYDSVNSRSGLMRSKSELDKFATSFAGEPTTYINMLFDAWNNLYRSKYHGDRAGAWKKVGRTVVVLGVTSLLTKAAVSLVYAMRDDDEDEAYWEKYMQALGEQLKTEINPLNSIPYARDIISIIKGWDVERPDLTVIADMVISGKRLWKAISDKDTSLDTVMKFADALGNVCNVPIKNVRRDAMALWRAGVHIFDDEKSDNLLEEFWNGVSEGTFFESTNDAKIKKVAKFVDQKNYEGATSYVSDWVNDKALELAEKDGVSAEDFEEFAFNKNKYTEEAKKSLRRLFTNEYKEEYLDAVEKKDVKTVKQIRVILFNTELYKEKKKGIEVNDIDAIFDQWRKEDFEKEYKEAYKTAIGTGDTKTAAQIESKVKASGFYKKPADTLKNWRKSAEETRDSDD